MARLLFLKLLTNSFFGWTIVSSSFQDFAYCGTRELIFSNTVQKFFLLCRFIDRYVHIVGEGDGVKKVYMDGYLDNQFMLLGWLSHRMAMPEADDNGPLIISEITNKLVFRWTIVSSSFQDFAYCGTRELIFSNPLIAEKNDEPPLPSNVTKKAQFFSPFKRILGINRRNGKLTRVDSLEESYSPCSP
ncbi:hypothetical protein CASFOL_022493 [Castilleja foliolosa]|uniref:Uncharacterized protein n=1 Tax=Castilleja foliolosa TaxID=1961234 RepID=A0ABD3CY24_9LAMI